jgi:hypothetical protein
MAPALNRWRWTALRSVERAGVPGMAAIVLLLLATAAGLAVALPQAERASELRADNDALVLKMSSKAKAKSMSVDGAPLGTERQLLDFEQGFPSDKALTASYARLWGVAKRHGVQLRQAEFKLSEPGQEALSRYAVVLPVTAEYAPLRAFVGDVLREIPSLALEEMSLRRDDAKAMRLDARLKFVLFVHRSE